MPRATERLDPALVRLCVVVVIGGAAPLLDTTIVAVALDALGRSFGADLATIQWAMSGYLLAMAMVTPATGWAVDRFGARRMWIGSVLAFGVASVLAGAAWSAGSLIAFRVLQGAAGGVLLPSAPRCWCRRPGRSGWVGSPRRCRCPRRSPRSSGRCSAGWCSTR